MKLKTYKKLFSSYVEKNIWVTFISILCIFIGMFIGIIYVNKTNNADYMIYFNENLKKLLNANINENLLFISSLKKNLFIISIIFITSFSFIGPFVTLLINFFKGFTLGFTGGFVITAMGLNGIKFLSCAVLPQNIFYILSLILVSLYSLKFSFRKYSWNNIDDYMTIGRYITYFLIFLFIAILGAIVECYMVPLLLKSVF